MKILNYDVPLGVSVSDYTPDGVEELIRKGFTHFEIGIPAVLSDSSEDNGKMNWRDREDELVAIQQPLADRIFENRLRVWSVHLPYGDGWDVAHYDEAERDAVCKSLKRIIDLTASWGPRVYVLHGCLEPVSVEERPIRIARSIRSLRELDAYASQYGARIALENLPRSCLANCSLETRAMVQAAGNVPVCFDVNHLLGETHEDFLKALAPRIITTHLSDYDGIDERHELPGTGIVPWKYIVSTLMEAGYRGPFLFELNNPYTSGEILDSFRRALNV